MDFCIDGSHTFLVDKPSNMTAAEAPASAYLTAVPNCTLSFQYTECGSSTKERWYCCVIVGMILSQLSSMWGIYLGIVCLM